MVPDSHAPLTAPLRCARTCPPARAPVLMCATGLAAGPFAAGRIERLLLATARAAAPRSARRSARRSAHGESPAALAPSRPSTPTRAAAAEASQAEDGGGAQAGGGASDDSELVRLAQRLAPRAVLACAWVEQALCALQLRAACREGPDEAEPAAGAAASTRSALPFLLPLPTAAGPAQEAALSSEPTDEGRGPHALAQSECALTPGLATPEPLTSPSRLPSVCPAVSPSTTPSKRARYSLAHLHALSEQPSDAVEVPRMLTPDEWRSLSGEAAAG